MKRGLLLLGLPALFVAIIAVSGIVRSRATPLGIGTVPSIISFTANPPVAKPGDPVVLAWNARGASWLNLDWGTPRGSEAGEPQKTNLPDRGSITVHPQHNMVYTLTCETPDGPMCTTDVSVRAE